MSNRWSVTHNKLCRVVTASVLLLSGLSYVHFTQDVKNTWTAARAPISSSSASGSTSLSPPNVDSNPIGDYVVDLTHARHRTALEKQATTPSNFEAVGSKESENANFGAEEIIVTGSDSEEDDFGNPARAPAEYQPSFFQLYVRIKYSKGWNETRSCLFPSLQLFWPQPHIVVALDGGSPQDEKMAPDVANLVANQYPPLEARGVALEDHILVEGTMGYGGWQRGQLDMMFADRVVKAKYVGLCDSDAMVVTVVTPRAIFTKNGRPVVHGSISRSVKHSYKKVPQGVLFMLKRPYVISCMSYFPVTLATEHIAMMRVHVENVHGKPFLQVYKELVLKFGYYCHFSIMCSYIWHFHRNKYDFHYQNFIRFERRWNATRPGEVQDFSFLTQENTKPFVRISVHFSYTSFGVPYDMPRGEKMIEHGRFGHLRNKYSPAKVRPLLASSFCFAALAQCRSVECDQLAKSCAKIGVRKEQLHTLLFRFENRQSWEWDKRVHQVQREYFHALQGYQHWLPYGKRVLCRYQKPACDQIFGAS